MQTDVQRILAATDFSPHASLALMRAARLAHSAGAELDIVHVARDEALLPAAYASAGDAADEGALDRLYKAAADVRARFDVPVHVHLAYGKPHVEIAAHAASSRAGLVVLGARGERAVRDIFIGSTARRMQRGLRAPMLIVRHASLRHYTRVLVATDFSAASAVAARAAERLFPDAALHYLHVCSALFESRLETAGVTREGILGYRNQVILDAGRALDRFIRQHGLQARRASALVRHGYPPAGIKDAAAELGASVVVLGSRGKSRFEAGFLGSVSEHFVSGTSHDVLLVKPNDVHLGWPTRDRLASRDARAIALQP